MSDPLAQFRKKPIGAAAAGPPASTDGYVAFGAKDRVERLKIRCAAAPTHAPSYYYLLDITYDGPYGTNFVLVFTSLIVLVKGKHLQPVIMALESGTADFIQEFDPAKWSKPTDAGAPLIESIQAIAQENPAMADMEKRARQVH